VSPFCPPAVIPQYFLLIPSAECATPLAAFFKEKTMRKTLILGVLSLGFMACAAQQKTSAEPEVATKDQAVEEKAPEIDSHKAGIEAHALVGDEATTFSAIYFEYDSDVLKSESTEVLKQVAEFMNNNPSAALTVEGHADERGTPEYNMALGDRRARAASQYLGHLGVKSPRVKTVSYGEEHPAIAGHDEEAWAKNRRGEFVLNSKKNSAVSVAK
jgi:peptidoglycan-associated lipoprotein